MLKILAVAAVLAVLGVILLISSRRGRERRGLGPGETIALDNVTLFSEHGLVGRPDRIVREGDFYIPEEWKSSKRINRGHELQLATYFLLIEEEYGVRPPHGFVVLGDGTRVEIENTDALRFEVLSIAEKIREHRATLAAEIPARQPAWKCRLCGQRRNCGQASS